MYKRQDRSSAEDDVSADSKIKTDDDDIKKKIEEEQAKIENVEEFTEEDEKSKQEYLDQSFGNWNKREFLAFISACIKFGRDKYDLISNAIHSKTSEEVKEYSAVFWQRYEEVQGWKKYVSNIEAGEKKTEKLRLQEVILKKKLEQYESPLVELNIQYPPNNTRRTYNSLEDRFLLVTVAKLGLFSNNLYELVKQEIVKSPLFTFAWFIRTRTPLDLSKRIATLLTLIQREFEGIDVRKKRRNDHAQASLQNETSEIGNLVQTSDENVEHSIKKGRFELSPGEPIPISN